MIIMLMVGALQWGHDLSVMDTRPSKTLPAKPELLQWGHDLSVMDTRKSER